MNEHMRRFRQRPDRMFRFYLIRPDGNSDIEGLIAKVINLRDVSEVHVTEGDYGFLIKTKTCKERDTDRVKEYLAMELRTKFGELTSHYSYRKR
ncbi:MAG: hypothetical protein KGH98_05070 [Candidatus Micrarchaeota archaeon]|nr:hypothetical protein [Candidatus Micrarchaeota archaeon]